jgi:hypothetical protein
VVQEGVGEEIMKVGEVEVEAMGGGEAVQEVGVTLVTTEAEVVEMEEVETQKVEGEIGVLVRENGTLKQEMVVEVGVTGVEVVHPQVQVFVKSVDTSNSKRLGVCTGQIQIPCSTIQTCQWLFLQELKKSATRHLQLFLRFPVNASSCSYSH